MRFLSRPPPSISFPLGFLGRPSPTKLDHIKEPGHRSSALNAHGGAGQWSLSLREMENKFQLNWHYNASNSVWILLFAAVVRGQSLAPNFADFFLSSYFRMPQIAFLPGLGARVMTGDDARHQTSSSLPTVESCKYFASLK